MTILATAALMTALVVQPPAERRAREPQTDQTVPVTRGARLSINNFAGEVVVRSWDKDAVRVQAQHSRRATIKIKTTPSGLSISAEGSIGPSTVDYAITAPSWMAIKIDGTYNFVSIEGVQSEVYAETVRGDIVVKGGSGTITAKSVEGEVIVEGARGKVSAHSVNEGIKVTNTTGEISAETINGPITLTGINSSSVDVATVNGDIVYDGVLTDNGSYRFATHNGDITMGVPESSNATFTVRTYNGEFSPTLPVKKSGDTPRGQRATFTLGNGSADVEAESFGGTIRLRRTDMVKSGRRE